MKIFISHSSINKPFAEKLIEYIGRDIVTFDKYSFEPGESLTESISNSIKKSDVLILLISQDALNSDWVEAEINLTSSLIVTQGLKFLPYCIDNTVKPKDKRLADWVWKRLITYFPTPKLLARVIERKIREQIWEKYPEKKDRDTLFIGRNSDMDILEKKYYSANRCNLKTVFISGFPFVGRKKILIRFIQTYIKSGDLNYKPFVIRLIPTNSIEHFVLQLNEFVEEVSNNDLLTELSKGIDNSITWAIRLLKKLENFNEYVIVEDDACIVTGGGFIAKWFLDLIQRKDFPTSLISIYVASRYRPSPKFINSVDYILEMPISTLSYEKMTHLLHECVHQKGKKLNKEDSIDLILNFTGYPKQAIDTAEYLSCHSLIQTKSYVKTLKSSYDGNYSKVIDLLSDGSKPLLVLLSRFDFISCDQLQEIVGDKDISEVLNELDNYSLLEFFGESNQFICLNSAISDYILRAKLGMDNELKVRLKEITKRLLSSIPSELTDLSSSLFTIKETIRSNTPKIDERYLIPSFVLKVIVEEYHHNNDKNVIAIANRLINQYKNVNYDRCIDAVHYWLCCSLCRLQKKDEFRTEVEYFADIQFDYNFLHGFFCRISGKRHELEQASLYYEYALKYKGADASTSIAKVLHEKVLVLMLLKRYKEALELAKQNYENNRHNTYHIRAYYNCLVHVSIHDKDILLGLIEEMRQSKERDFMVFVKAMQAQYEYYVNNDFSKAINIFRTVLIHQNGDGIKYAKDALREICHLRDANSIYNDIVSNID